MTMYFFALPKQLSVSPYSSTFGDERNGLVRGADTEQVIAHFLG